LVTTGEWVAGPDSDVPTLVKFLWAIGDVKLHLVPCHCVFYFCSFYQWRHKMARVCQVSGKRRMVGNNVSHSMRKTKRVQHPNLLKKRIYIPEENRTVTLRLSARALRTMNKKGVLAYLKEQGIKV
jgi:large subunit ribosomal protein L28